MASGTNPQRKLQEEQDRVGVSAQDEVENPILGPERQDQVDKNRVPTEAAPIALATPSKRSSEQLDEEE